MNITYSIMGVIGKFTPLNTSSLSTAINYNPNNNDNYSSRDISGMNISAKRTSGTLGMLSSVAQKGASYSTYKGIMDIISRKVRNSKGNFLFVVTIGLRNSDNAPTRIMSVDRVYTANPESKARFMSLIDKQCDSGKISCVSLAPITKEMHNARVYIIARTK